MGRRASWRWCFGRDRLWHDINRYILVNDWLESEREKYYWYNQYNTSFAIDAVISLFFKYPYQRLTCCCKVRSVVTKLSTRHVGNAQGVNEAKGLMPDCIPGPAENVRDQLVGTHLDFHEWILVVHLLLVCRVLTL